jgi:hypothetical protein
MHGPPVISMLGKHLTLRQRVIATACDCHSLLQAILGQELALRDSDRHFYRMLLRRRKGGRIPRPPKMSTPNHASCSVVRVRQLHFPHSISIAAYTEEGYGVKNFPSDNSKAESKLAEMEFYLVSDLGCDLVVFLP